MGDCLQPLVKIKDVKPRIVQQLCTLQFTTIKDVKPHIA